jgi:hypothetical protein
MQETLDTVEDILEVTTPKKKKRRGAVKSSRSRSKLTKQNQPGGMLNKLQNEFSFLSELNVEKDVLGRITRSLMNVEKGSEDVVSTPLGKQQLIALDLVDKLIESKRHLLNKVLLDIESAQKSKVGPRSIAKAWPERKGALNDYFTKNEVPEIRNSQPQTKSDEGRLRPIDLEKAVDKLKSNTNAGLPFYVKKGNVKDIYRNSTKFRELLDRRDPCCLFTRTQEDGKTRSVWGYPMADTINEMLFYSPLLQYQKSLNWRAAIVTPEAIDDKVIDIVKNCVIFDDYTMVSIDFSAYDASVKGKLQSFAFQYIKALFQPNNEAALSYVEERFKTIGIITPEGVLNGKHGVPSGSTFTNEVDSIAQYLVARNSDLLIDKNFQIQGDDGLYLVKKNQTSTLISNFEKFGLKVNKSKSTISDEYCTYLQCLYHKDYCLNLDKKVGGIYPIYRALCRLMYQERFVDYAKVGLSGREYFTLRTICILENCKYHPLFEDFVKIIYDLDVEGLNYESDAPQKFERLIYGEEGVLGNIQNQHGDIRSGMESFETVKVLRKLRVRMKE